MPVFTKRVFRSIMVIAGAIAIILLFMYGGTYLLIRVIAAQRSCAWANIDNVELNMEINIPELKADPVCMYDKQQNRKVNYFVLDKNKVPVKEYIRLNNFRPLEPGPVTGIDELNMVYPLNLEKLNPAALFWTEHTYTDGTSYKALLDTAGAQLWVSVSYAG